MIREISVKDLKKKLDEKDNFILIDVREPHEYNLSNIEESELIPLGDLEGELGSLNKTASYVIHCRSGKRSAMATEMMKENGFTDVINLKGGIVAWASEIDPSLTVA